MKNNNIVTKSTCHKEKLFTKNFTLLIFGQVSSLLGNMILRFALSMHILEVTGSATVFAGIMSATLIPIIILSPFGGILADRANRRNIMVMLDLISGVAVLLSMLFFSQKNDIVVITILMIALSILGAFESPTVNACVPQMQSGDNIIKANAVVNQVVAVSSLIAPIFGGMIYSLLGLKPVMIITTACFLLTAFFECFINLPYTKRKTEESLKTIIIQDFKESIKFISKKQPIILKMLLSVSVVSFFLMGSTTVGYPYMIRNILGLSSGYYAAAESVLGIFAIVGSVLAGVFITKFKSKKMYLILIAVGLCFLPCTISFMINASAITNYVTIVLSICLVQVCATIFSIFAMSIIQQKTPNEMLGKTMSYITTITLCSQPLGQMLYGFLFDTFSSKVYLILLFTSLAVIIVGLLSKRSFNSMFHNNE